MGARRLARGGGVTRLDAKRQGSLLEAVNGKRRPDVPNVVARAQAARKFASVGAPRTLRL